MRNSEGRESRVSLLPFIVESCFNNRFEEVRGGGVSLNARAPLGHCQPRSSRHSCNLGRLCLCFQE